jgi:hypothetical protein
MSSGVERKIPHSSAINEIREEQRDPFAFKNFLKDNRIALDPSIPPSDMQLLEEFYRLRQQVLEGKLDPLEVAKCFETMVEKVYPQERQEEFYKRMAKTLGLITKLTSNQ